MAMRTATTAPVKQRFSLRREAASEGGGMDGATALMNVECIQEFTYGGQQKPQAAIRVTYKVKGSDKGKEPWIDHHTIGPADRYEVVEDGTAFKPLGTTKGINTKSGAYFFMNAVQNAAEASGLKDDDILPYVDVDGMELTSLAELDGKWVVLGQEMFTPMNGDPKAKYVPVKFLDEAVPTKGSTKKAAPISTDTEDEEESEELTIDEQAEEAVLAQIAKAKKPIKQSDLGALVFHADRSNPVIKAIMKLAASAAWVSSEDRPWTYDRKKMTVSAAD